MNLGRYVSRSAKFYPEQNAMIFEGRQITYRELDRRTNCLAQGFYAQGLKKGHAATEEEIMGHCRESLAGDPRYDTNVKRLQHRDTLMPLFEARMRERE